MLLVGHSRPNWALRVTSAFPPTATKLRTSLVVWLVPKARVADASHAKKSHPKAAPNSNPMTVDQAAIKAGLDFRR